MKKYYQETAKTVLERVNSRGTGLTGEEVEKSRERCGWNELVEGKKKRIPQIFLEQYKDFLVLILIASAIISGNHRNRHKSNSDYIKPIYIKGGFFFR